ncbi:pyruvate carboxyltransferase [Streptomyces alfalfae]|uniref:2-isopropylmalate synthase n=1 Tax=Streptomyces alfalfae TaxID=1642299 RepID=A0ABM6GMG8_9ACTN|nr:pyruvate carboxyltransferase [Streptomyces alfalfae]APY84878.1 pyruvate carboxyltransferase [Streptomyces alfalfae]QUI35305.1 pyruvate carboxyltransferase [Streptomyces alfalfae]RXX45756.1 pyruvate carboxyltransferase [Streptomyces alfalfae]RZM90339.1 pyruvate carboxyltransferase [Streptomyces alfalfae]
MEKRRVSIFDTTLRDGEQAPRNSMKPQEKLELALRIEALGVDVVETGFPASSPAEMEATRLISRHLTRARFTTFCRAVRSDIDCAVAAGGTRNHEVQILATSSELHLDRKRRISRKESIDEIVECVTHARRMGVPYISLALEDASRGSDELLRAQTEAGVEAGVTCVVAADTSGCMTPAEYGELVGKIRSWAPPSISVFTHCHEDFGLSTANTLAGLQAGADGVQTTVGGIGERAGNAALEELVALLSYKSDSLGLYTDIDTVAMYGVYEALRDIIGLDQPRNKAIFGTYAFGSAAGIHQAGILRDPATYEFVEPDRFGRERSLLIARHSGRSVLRHLLENMRVDVDDDRMEALYRRHITERVGGDCEDISVLRRRLADELLTVGAAH